MAEGAAVRPTSVIKLPTLSLSCPQHRGRCRQHSTCAHTVHAVVARTEVCRKCFKGLLPRGPRFPSSLLAEISKRSLGKERGNMYAFPSLVRPMHCYPPLVGARGHTSSTYALLILFHTSCSAAARDSPADDAHFFAVSQTLPSP